MVLQSLMHFQKILEEFCCELNKIWVDHYLFEILYLKFAMCI